MIKKEDFLTDTMFVLRETFEGSPEGEGSAYLDNRVGVFPTIAEISYNDASHLINETTIAAHTAHLKFYLDRICEFIGGRTEKVNWQQSWLIETVDETEWNVLRDGVRSSYESVLKCFAGVENWNQDNIGDAIAIIAHTAYHLGAIRQIAKSV